MLEIGSTVGGIYKILNVIGKGGMSVVYLAMNEKANKQWAIKEVRKDGLKDFEVVKQGLIVETNMLKKLNHPNLPSIIDVIDKEDTFIIVMDYIEGNPLSKSIEEFGALPQEQVIMWAKQLCDVLGYLHTRTPPIIYRDMKPSNVMLCPDQKTVKLIDFGTAREYKSQNIADTTCLGTIGYAAPEQFGGQGQTDARTDIYCLGATLYHLVTGQNPCEPPYEIKPIREWNPSLSEGLEKIILKCTQKNPDDRYQSCAQLLYDLEHYQELDARTRRTQKRKLRLFISLLAASAVFFAGGFGAKALKVGKTEEIYTAYINQADNAMTSQEKISNYQQAIELMPTRIEPYEKLVSAMAEDDVLSSEELSILRGYNSNIKALNTESAYPSLVYNIAKLYWSCYTPVQAENINQNILNAKEWLDILSSYSNFESAKTVAVMKNIADYTFENQRAMNQVDNGKSNESEIELFNSLNDMVDFVQTDTSDILKLKTYDCVRYILSQEATYFKLAEIPYTDVNKLYCRVKDGVNAINNPNLTDAQNKIITKFKTTEESIINAYAVERGGN